MPTAKPGYLIDELARVSGATPRAIRYWVRRGVLASPHARGPNTRYAPACVARIAALRVLQAQGASLREVRKRFDNATPAEIEAIVHPPAPTPTHPPAAAPAAHAERWQRFAIAPGLELHLRDGAGDAVAAHANENATRWGSRVG